MASQTRPTAKKRKGIVKKHIIVRFPENQESLLKSFTSPKTPSPSLELISVGTRNRVFNVKIAQDVYPALLLDLPCHVEAHKTFGDSTVYKGGDISQILKIYPKDWDGKDFTLADPSLRTNAESSQNIIDLDFSTADGLTPPTEGIKNAFKDPKVCLCEIPIEFTIDNAPAKKKVEWATQEIMRARKGDFNEFYSLDEQFYETDQTVSSDGGYDNQ